jgi:hypothetical protein
MSVQVVTNQISSTLKQSITEKIITNDFLWKIFSREEDMDFIIEYDCTDIINGEYVLNFGFVTGPENVSGIQVFLNRGTYEFEVEPIFRLKDTFLTTTVGDILA